MLLNENEPGEFKLSCNKDLLEEKKGLRLGFGVDDMLIVSISGPDSDKSSSSSKKSSISVGSTSPPESFLSMSS